jgi:hypothetical protein
MIGSSDTSFSSDQEDRSSPKGELQNCILQAEKALNKFNMSHQNLTIKGYNPLVMQRQTYVDANVFAKVMLRLNTLARIVFLDNVEQYKVIRPYWQEVSEAIRELAMKTSHELPSSDQMMVIDAQQDHTNALLID